MLSGTHRFFGRQFFQLAREPHGFHARMVWSGFLLPGQWPAFGQRDVEIWRRRRATVALSWGGRFRRGKQQQTYLFPFSGLLFGYLDYIEPT